MPAILVKPVIETDKVVRNLWCVRPYPGHPHGCPNFNHKKGCPPDMPLLDEVLDLSKPVWAVYNAYDFGAHRERMRSKHPTWSDRQLRCCLYWQPAARKYLDVQILMHCFAHSDQKIIYTPEAYGVDVTATMHNAGIDLEWPPVNVAYQIVFTGTNKLP